MSDIVVRLGNTAPTNSIRRECSKEEAQDAGALGRKELDAQGKTVYFVLDQEPVKGNDAAITTFVIPHGTSIIDGIRNVGFSFGSQHSTDAPAWVHVDGEHYVAELVAQHFASVHDHDIDVLTDDDVAGLLGPVIKPKDVKTLNEQDNPPIAGGAIQAIGRDLWAQALADASGTTGTATGDTATSLTNSGAGWTTNQWAGKSVTMGGAVATILSNTATVLTIARWETPGSRSGAVAGTPTAGVYVINSGQDPAYWMAVTANSTAPTTGGADTTLTAEITTGGSGFLRAVPTYGHTTGTNTFTLTITYTATGSDTFPQAINKIGVFNAQNGGRLLFETLLSATFTANQSGDAVTITDTITGT